MNANLLPPPEFISSFDGTRLALFELGKLDGPPLFLINGLGGNLQAWKFIIAHFQDRFRIVSYDYRGMYKSGSSPGNDYSMTAHTRDALVVLEHFKIEQAVVMGWSMGVQIALEVIREAPEKALALVFANGAYGRPLDRSMPRLKPLARLTMDLLARYAPLLRPLARPVLCTTAPLKAAKAVGLVSKHLDEQVFSVLARDFAQLDFKAYRDSVDALLEHDAEDVLETITVPTLVLGGGRDFFAPHAFINEMKRRIPNVRIRVIDDASHYAAVEYPGILISHMERFFLEELDL